MISDPQDRDRVIEEWGCAVNFQFMGLLEVAKRVTGGLDGVQKATESFRNEVVEAQTHMNGEQRYAINYSPK